MRALAIPAAALALAGCGASPASSSGNSAAPSQEQQAALTEINQFRGEAKARPLSFSQALDVAATRHAGWQANQYGTAVQLTHYETVDGTATGASATANPYFTAVQFTDRIRAANNGADLLPSATVIYSEGLTSAAGPPTIAALWNTVYHRLPLIRSTTELFGFGDAAQAGAQYGMGTIPTGVVGYGTAELAGSTTVPITPSWWPTNALTNVPYSFSSDHEFPDPIGLQQPGGTQNSYQSPQLWSSDIDVVGEPLIVIIPTSLDWASVSVSLYREGTTAQLATWVLAGFVNSGTRTAPVFPATMPTGATCFDANLDPGELVVVPQAALLPTTRYVWEVQAQSVTAGSVSDAIDTGLVTFTTAP